MFEQKSPSACPSCGSNLVIETLRCPACSTTVEGTYTLAPFMRLRDEQLEFCETFLRCRGNLKDVCAVLDISYPTARNRLDTLLEALEFEQDETRRTRLAVLEKLTRGEISHAEALNLLKGGKGK